MYQFVQYTFKILCWRFVVRVLDEVHAQNVGVVHSNLDMRVQYKYLLYEYVNEHMYSHNF